MSSNSYGTDKIVQDINTFFSCEKSEKSALADSFYAHLASLLKYYLATADNDEDDHLEINGKTYSELELFAMENSRALEYVEGHEIDWDIIDDGKDIFKDRLSEAVGKEIASDYLRPVARFMSDTYENWLIYDQMHPGSVFNPWISFMNLMRKGYVFLISDNKNILTEYVRDIYEKTDPELSDNIAFIAKHPKDKKFSGFLADNRHNSQISAYQFLKKNAPGFGNAKDSEMIRAFLSEHKDRSLGKQKLMSMVLHPLKYTGLVGSWPKGFFHITTSKDLPHALRSHRSQKILEIYKRRGQILQAEEKRYELAKHWERGIPYEANTYSPQFLYEQYHSDDYSNILLPLLDSHKKLRREDHA